MDFTSFMQKSTWKLSRSDDSWSIPYIRCSNEHLELDNKSSLTQTFCFYSSTYNVCSCLNASMCYLWLDGKGVCRFWVSY